MAPSMVASIILDSTRIELALYRSSDEFISLVRLDVTAKQRKRYDDEVKQRYE